MRIIILVLSSLKTPYDQLMKAQQRTWDNVEVEGVETVYYYGVPVGENHPGIFFKMKLRGKSMMLNVDESDEYNMMHWKLKITLDYINTGRWPYDFIFRTNSSSYVDKQMLKEFAETLPKEKCYCGISGEGFASGSGFFLSPDCAEILRNELTIDPHGAEDVLCGSILAKHGVGVTPGAQRFIFNNPDDAFPDVYHYRMKLDMKEGRMDAVAMERVHKFKERRLTGLSR